MPGKLNMLPVGLAGDHVAYIFDRDNAAIVQGFIDEFSARALPFDQGLQKETDEEGTLTVTVGRTLNTAFSAALEGRFDVTHAIPSDSASQSQRPAAAGPTPGPMAALMALAGGSPLTASSQSSSSASSPTFSAGSGAGMYANRDDGDLQVAVQGAPAPALDAMEPPPASLTQVSDRLVYNAEQLSRLLGDILNKYLGEKGVNPRVKQALEKSLILRGIFGADYKLGLDNLFSWDSSKRKLTIRGSEALLTVGMIDNLAIYTSKKMRIALTAAEDYTYNSSWFSSDTININYQEGVNKLIRLGLQEQIRVLPPKSAPEQPVAAVSSAQAPQSPVDGAEDDAVLLVEEAAGPAEAAVPAQATPAASKPEYKFDSSAHLVSYFGEVLYSSISEQKSEVRGLFEKKFIFDFLKRQYPSLTSKDIRKMFLWDPSARTLTISGAGTFGFDSAARQRAHEVVGSLQALGLNKDDFGYSNGVFSSTIRMTSEGLQKLASLGVQSRFNLSPAATAAPEAPVAPVAASQSVVLRDVGGVEIPAELAEKIKGHFYSPDMGEVVAALAQAQTHANVGRPPQAPTAPAAGRSSTAAIGTSLTDAAVGTQPSAPAAAPATPPAGAAAADSRSRSLTSFTFGSSGSGSSAATPAGTPAAPGGPAAAPEVLDRPRSSRF